MEKIVCPKCGSDDLYKYGENFQGEFFECLDCDVQFQLKWNGEITILREVERDE